jgi:hypothetical protein
MLPWGEGGDGPHLGAPSHGLSDGDDDDVIVARSLLCMPSLLEQKDMRCASNSLLVSSVCSCPHHNTLAPFSLSRPSLYLTPIMSNDLNQQFGRLLSCARSLLVSYTRRLLKGLPDEEGRVSLQSSP